MGAVAASKAEADPGAGAVQSRAVLLWVSVMAEMLKVWRPKPSRLL